MRVRTLTMTFYQFVNWYTRMKQYFVTLYLKHIFKSNGKLTFLINY